MICFVKNVAGQSSNWVKPFLSVLSKFTSRCLFTWWKNTGGKCYQKWQQPAAGLRPRPHKWSSTRAGAWELQPSHSWGGRVTLVPPPRLSLPLTCRAHLLTHILLLPREWSSQWTCLHALCDPPRFFPVPSGVKPSTPVKSTRRFSAFQTFM